MNVSLASHELLLGSAVGSMRQIAALKRGLRDQHGLEGDGWTKHIEGACGELAVAKLLGRFWGGGINDFKRADDVRGLQVRTRSRDEYDLLVRKDDRDGDRFVLVTGTAHDYAVRGWLYGSEAKQDRWLASHGGRPPAWFVPAAELHPLDLLEVLDQVFG
jgi:hypothetical protein